MRTSIQAVRYRPIALFLAFVTLFQLSALPIRAQAQAITLLLIQPDTTVQEITNTAEARFAALATTAPEASAATDGVGIAAVTFQLRDDQGQEILVSRDVAAPYCTGEDASGCAPLDPALVAALDGQALLLTVTAEALDGATTALEWPFSVALAPSEPARDSAPQVAEGTAATPPVVRFTVPTDNATVTERQDTAFALTAHDPAVGTADGAGITWVDVQLVHDDAILSTRRERSRRYCVFGNNGPCALLPTDLWNDLAADTYTLRARATSRRGVRSAWVEQTVRIDPQGSVPAPPPSDELRRFRPQEIPTGAPEIVNPLRGLYRWNNQEIAPQPQPARDSYARYVWRDLEPSRGQYDFAVLERDLAAAERAGRKHAFRIRVLATGSTEGAQVPDYLRGEMAKGWWFDYNGDGRKESYVPDWNDPAFLDRLRSLINALGARYNDDPRVAWVDIGFYGNWGEWHMHRFPYPSPSGAQNMTSANRRALVDWHLAAFPTTPLVMLTDDEATLRYALQRSPRIGWRRDSLGWPHFDAIQRDAATWALLRDRWQTAPVITEFGSTSRIDDPESYRLALDQVRRYHISLVGNGNTFRWSSLSSAGQSAFLQLGKAAGYRLVLSELAITQELRAGEPFHVATRWINRGNAPVYEAWRPTLELRDDAGRVRWSRRLDLNLAALLPSDTATQAENRFTLPELTAPGTYDLVLVMRDPAGYRAPLALAVAGRRDDGSYPLGTVVVSRAEGQRGPNITADDAHRLLLPLMVRVGSDSPASPATE